jgi:hypothetical protein
MVSEKRAATKTQTLSLRLDPKTRFVLEFVSRVRGQNITTVVERAIKEATSQVVLEPGRSETFDDRPNWLDFWDPSEGVRMLKLLSDDRYPSTFEEDELRDFTSAHSEFFYVGKDQPHGPYLDILWPSIDQFLATWRTTKTSDYWAAGRAMVDALRTAKVSAPEWPRKKATQKQASFDQELEDEIPF